MPTMIWEQNPDGSRRQVHTVLPGTVDYLAGRATLESTGELILIGCDENDEGTQLFSCEMPEGVTSPEELDWKDHCVEGNCIGDLRNLDVVMVPIDHPDPAKPPIHYLVGHVVLMGSN